MSYNDLKFIKLSVKQLNGMIAREILLDQFKPNLDKRRLQKIINWKIMLQFIVIFLPVNCVIKFLISFFISYFYYVKFGNIKLSANVGLLLQTATNILCDLFISDSYLLTRIIYHGLTFFNIYFYENILILTPITSWFNFISCYYLYDIISTILMQRIMLHETQNIIISKRHDFHQMIYFNNVGRFDLHKFNQNSLYGHIKFCNWRDWKDVKNEVKDLIHHPYIPVIENGVVGCFDSFDVNCAKSIMNRVIESNKSGNKYDTTELEKANKMFVGGITHTCTMCDSFMTHLNYNYNYFTNSCEEVAITFCKTFGRTFLTNNELKRLLLISLKSSVIKLLIFIMSL